MWQVSGRSDITDFEEVVRLDTEYISKDWPELPFAHREHIGWGTIKCLAEPHSTAIYLLVLLKLRDTTMAAIDEARFSQVVGRLQESMAVPITGRVQDVVQLTAQSYGINAEEQEGILKYLIEGGDLSLYGLSNAVTRASQDVVSYDRATTLEGIGWQVATMEPQQWKQINQ